MNEVRHIESTVRMSDFSVINSDFTRARCRVMCTGRNRNYTDITDNAVSKLINRKGYANVPVVAHLYKDDSGNWRVGGHDSKIVWGSDGSVEIIDETVPFGVIPESCNPQIEEVTENSGEVKRYFCVDVVLWTHRYNIMDAVKSDELWFNQSMEITFDEYRYDGDYCVIEDFNLSALCLLNHDPYNKENEVVPCFPSACVSKFALGEKFKSEFDVMCSKLRDYELSNERSDYKMEIAEIKAKVDTKFSVLSITPDSVCAMNKENFEVFEIPYSVGAEKSEVVFGYDKAVRKYLAVSDTDSGIEDAVKGCTAEFGKSVETKTKEDAVKKFETDKAEMTKGFVEKIDAQNAEIEQLKAELGKVNKDLTVYKAAEVQAREAAHRAEIDKVVDSYAARLEKNTDYYLYRTSDEKYSKTAQEVEQDMLIILGKSVKNNETAKFSYVAWGANPATPKPGSSGRYGDLMDYDND